MHLPVFTAFEALRRSGDRFTLLLVTALSVYAVLVLTIPVSTTAQELAITRFHANGWSFPAWAMLQPTPWMYNFENRMAVEYARSDQAECRARTEFVNHQPYGKLFAPYDRHWYRQCGGARVRFSTTYRGLAVETSYVVEPMRDGKGLTVGRAR
jgi:hypothetical protein